MLPSSYLFALSVHGKSVNFLSLLRQTPGFMRPNGLRSAESHLPMEYARVPSHLPVAILANQDVPSKGAHRPKRIV